MLDIFTQNTSIANTLRIQITNAIKTKLIYLIQIIVNQKCHSVDSISII